MGTSYKILLLIIFCFTWKGIFSQTTVLGEIPNTQIKVFEYYNHTGESKWVKLFRIKNYNSSLGYWGKGGVAGTVYYVDYQGEGASKVDFVFPQSIFPGQKPNLNITGNSSNDFSWYALKNQETEGQEFYDVYLKTSPWHVGFSFILRGNDYDAFFVEENPPMQSWTWSSLTDNESIFTFKGNGKVGIGILNPQNTLDVNGTLHAREVKVDLTGWSDFVFHPSYKLKPLTEVEQFIKTNGHLQDIPSAAEVEQNGVNMGEMQAKLLQKVEELTLYVIEKDKEIQSLTQIVTQQQQMIEELLKKTQTNP